MAGESKGKLPELIEDETLDLVIGGAAQIVPKGFKVEIEGFKPNMLPGDGSVKVIPGDGSVRPGGG